MFDLDHTEYAPRWTNNKRKRNVLFSSRLFLAWIEFYSITTSDQKYRGWTKILSWFRWPFNKRWAVSKTWPFDCTLFAGKYLIHSLYFLAVANLTSWLSEKLEISMRWTNLLRICWEYNRYFIAFELLLPFDMNLSEWILLCIWLIHCFD